MLGAEVSLFMTFAAQNLGARVRQRAVEVQQYQAPWGGRPSVVQAGDGLPGRGSSLLARCTAGPMRPSSCGRICGRVDRPPGTRRRCARRSTPTNRTGGPPAPADGEDHLAPTRRSGRAGTYLSAVPPGPPRRVVPNPANSSGISHVRWPSCSSRRGTYTTWWAALTSATATSAMNRIEFR